MLGDRALLYCHQPYVGICFLTMASFSGFNLGATGRALDKVCTALALPPVPPSPFLPPGPNGEKPYGTKQTYDHIIFVMEKVGCPVGEFRGYHVSNYAYAFQYLAKFLLSTKRLPENFF